MLKDIHIYMYLFCGRPCRRPVDGADVNVFFFAIEKKMGETGPIAKPSEMSNMYVLKSGKKNLVLIHYKESFHLGTSEWIAETLR